MPPIEKAKEKALTRRIDELFLTCDDLSDTVLAGIALNLLSEVQRELSAEGKETQERLREVKRRLHDIELAAFWGELNCRGGYWTEVFDGLDPEDRDRYCRLQHERNALYGQSCVSKDICDSCEEAPEGSPSCQFKSIS